MIFLSLLLWIFAVCSDAADPVKLFEKLTKDSKPVLMTNYFHRPAASYKDILGGRNANIYKMKWKIEDITSTAAQLLLGSAAERWVKGIMRRSVYMETYFRAPPASRNSAPEAHVEVFFFFSYAPGTVFYWDPESHETRFQDVKTLRNNEQYHKAVYKVLCRPGSVFPIRLMVLDVQDRVPFALEWSMAESDVSNPTAQQLVTMSAAKKSFTILSKLGAVPAAVGQINEPCANILLSLYLRAPTIERFATLFHRKDQFILDGFFKPRQKLNRFVLSSTTPVAVEIYGIPQSRSQHRFHTLVALEGHAQEQVIELNPRLFYKITVWGRLSNANFVEFTLMAFDPKNKSACSDVNLLIPGFDERGQRVFGEVGPSPTRPSASEAKA